MVLLPGPGLTRFRIERKLVRARKLGGELEKANARLVFLIALSFTPFMLGWKKTAYTILKNNRINFSH